ncbi:MAG: PDZ domain-containing protein [Planctomycetota bacterium]
MSSLALACSAQPVPDHRSHPTPPDHANANAAFEILVANQPVALGTFVASPERPDSDSHRFFEVLTKASETHPPAERSADALIYQVVTPDGARHRARSLATDRSTDLRLLRVSFRPDARGPEKRLGRPIPSQTQPESKPPPPGSFVSVPIPRSVPYTGIIAAPPRPVPSDAKMGVFFAEGTPRPVVRAVQPGSGADAAGLQRGDLLLRLDETPTPTPLAVIDALQSQPRYPGDAVTVTFQRATPNPARDRLQTLTRKVELGRAPPAPTNREQRLESHAPPTSGRASGFPLALPADAPVPAQHCGGPVYALDGRFLGMAIARSGRTETLILPPDQIAQALERMRAR